MGGEVEEEEGDQSRRTIPDVVSRLESSKPGQRGRIFDNSQWGKLDHAPK